MFEMHTATHPSTADLEYVEHLCSTPQRATEVKHGFMDRVVALALKPTVEAAVGNDIIGAHEAPAKRKRGSGDSSGSSTSRSSNTPSPGVPVLVFANNGTRLEKAKREKFNSLGFFQQVVSYR